MNNGTYTGTDHPGELFFIADENYTYAVYRDSYYRWNSTTDENSSRVTIRLRPVSATRVSDTLATPYRNASSGIKQVIRQGNASPGMTLRTGLFERNDTYYTVTVTNEASVFASIIFAPITLVLQTVGRAYAVVAAGLLILLRMKSPNLHPVTLRSSLVLAAAVVPVIWILTTLTESGSIGLRYVVQPAAGFCVALGVFAGFTVRCKTKKMLAVTTGLIVITAVIGSAILAGPFAAIGALFGLFIAWGQAFRSSPMVTISVATNPQKPVRTRDRDNRDSTQRQTSNGPPCIEPAKVEHMEGRQDYAITRITRKFTERNQLPTTESQAERSSRKTLTKVDARNKASINHDRYIST